ncbi:hypothetical protein V8G54_004836 [Vigna mungo]|uniref:Uncharacterized protein n=1 Tax=Vigna mungo TaxID=3915 RepID=A0AAQ3PEK7_VIGMU
MGSEYKKLMILPFLIAISFSVIMDGALATRHLMQTFDIPDLPDLEPGPEPDCIMFGSTMICPTPVGLDPVEFIVDICQFLGLHCPKGGFPVSEVQDICEYFNWPCP